MPPVAGSIKSRRFPDLKKERKEDEVMSYGKATATKVSHANPATAADGSADLNGCEGHFSDASAEGSDSSISCGNAVAAASASDAKDADARSTASDDALCAFFALYARDSRNAHGMYCGSMISGRVSRTSSMAADMLDRRRAVIHNIHFTSVNAEKPCFTVYT